MNTLWGLLIVHQCDAPRQWQEEDIQLLHQLSIHLAISLYQAELYQNLESLNSSLEEKVQERTKKLQLQSQVLEEIHDGVVTTDLNGTILSWNLGAEKLYGYTEAEVLGRNVAFMYEDAEALGAEVIVPLLDKGSHATEVVIFSKSGKRIYISLRLSVVKDEQGNITHLIGCANDISDRKRAEHELQQLNQDLEARVERRTALLRKSEQRFISLAAAAPVAIFRINQDNNCTYVNEFWTQITGQEPEVALGYGWIETIHPDDREQIHQQWTQAIEQQAPYQGEGRCIRPDGTIRYYYCQALAETDEDGNFMGYIGTLTDISDRKRAEAELQNLSNRLGLALRSGAIGCWEWDLVNNIKVWDERMCEIYGLSTEEIDSMNYERWASVLHPEDRTFTTTLLQQAISGEAEYDTEFRILHPDGNIGFIKAYGIVVRDAQGNLQSMIGINFDISDRKQAEIQLKHINEELLRATKLKDEFLANMSHELRTPLNSILGLSNVLGEQVLGSLNERQIKAIGTVESSGEHLLSLINDILDLSKISSGMMELNVESVLVKNLCDSSLVFVKQQAFQKQVQIASNIPKNINKINVEERRIRQVLINLLTNAIKFTPSEGQVNLLVAVGRGDTWQGEATIPQRIKLMNSPMIVFQVVDTGIGIAANDLQRLFQPFVQISSSLNRQYEGTGLGLALVKQIVELHGGQVMAESEVGKGSCFSVALPYEMSQSSAPESPTVSTTLPPVVIDPDNAPLILLAEDNEANIQTFSSYLTAINYRIVTARNGEEAVAMAKAESPDIILMDIQMPDMDGLEAIALIRADETIAAIPIIALTALAMEGDRERCLAAGANEYLSKPIKFRQLNSAIQRILA
jgi:PAS domain S-box-containing protein